MKYKMSTTQLDNHINPVISTFIYMFIDAIGRNSLKQRYRELAKEFHPDSGTNLDLPDSTVNSLMANLTGMSSLLYWNVSCRAVSGRAAVRRITTTVLWMMIKIGLMMAV